MSETAPEQRPVEPTETATAGQTGTVARVLAIGDHPYV